MANCVNPNTSEYRHAEEIFGKNADFLIKALEVHSPRKITEDNPLGWYEDSEIDSFVLNVFLPKINKYVSESLKENPMLSYNHITKVLLAGIAERDNTNGGYYIPNDIFNEERIKLFKENALKDFPENFRIAEEGDRIRIIVTSNEGNYEKGSIRKTESWQKGYVFNPVIPGNIGEMGFYNGLQHDPNFVKIFKILNSVRNEAPLLRERISHAYFKDVNLKFSNENEITVNMSGGSLSIDIDNSLLDNNTGDPVNFAYLNNFSGKTEYKENLFFGFIYNLPIDIKGIYINPEIISKERLEDFGFEVKEIFDLDRGLSFLSIKEGFKYYDKEFFKKNETQDFFTTNINEYDIESLIAGSIYNNGERVVQDMSEEFELEKRIREIFLKENDNNNPDVNNMC